MKAPPEGAKLLTLNEVDRIYRKQKQTASRAWKAGELPGKRVGNRVLVSAKRAEELYGVGA